jgi:hypothetical protein
MGVAEQDTIPLDPAKLEDTTLKEYGTHIKIFRR